MRLLIIEDQKKIVLPLKKALERRLFVVEYALDGQEGYGMARSNPYDCIILDLNLPGMDGLEVAEKLREAGVFTPILMLTARTEQEDLVAGFERGADDFLRKPFHFKELLLRIHALIRRNSINKADVLSAGDLMVDTKLKKVFRNSQEIKCNAKEYGILEYLLRHRGRVVSQEELLEHIWDREIDSFTQTVRTNVKTLRQKVDPEKRIITTVKGSGYTIDVQ
ncbi:MAG: response regulator transcription factor [bacterium]